MILNIKMDTTKKTITVEYPDCAASAVLLLLLGPERSESEAKFDLIKHIIDYELILQPKVTKGE